MKMKSLSLFGPEQSKKKGMNDFMKKICLLLAMLFLLSCFGGCTLEGTKQEEEVNPGYSTEIPTYADDKQLEVMAFWSPPINEQSYTWMKECGITAVLVDNKFDAQSGSNRRRILEMCTDLDIDVYFPMSRDQSGEAIKNYENWLEYSSFAGFYCDEPITKGHIDNIADQAREAQALSPELRMISNMLSDYSDNGEGYGWIYSDQADYQAALADGQFFSNYEAYVKYMQDTVIGRYDNVVVSATNYPLAAWDKGYDTTLVETWLKTLGLSKQTALQCDKDMWQFIATTAYHSGGKEFYHRQPVEADIRWMNYVALAYGATGIEEFVYTTVGAGVEFDEDDHGPIWWMDVNDTSSYYRTDMWYAVQAVHQELFEFDHVLLSFDWKGVLCHNVTDDPSVTPVFENAVGKLEKHERLQDIDSTGDLLIGCFEDDNDYDGFLVVNFTETARNSYLKNEVSIRFDYANKALVYVNGEEQLIELKDHTYTGTLLPGDAFFIIPIA